MARVFKKNDAWWIDFSDSQGIRRRKKVGPSKRVAREVLDGILGSVARRVHLGVIDDSRVSFADFADDWWQRVVHTLKPRTQERFRGIVDTHLKPSFPGALRGMTAADVERYVSRRVSDGAQPSTVNRELTVLKHMLRRAVTWGLLSRNPLADNQGKLLETLRPLKEPAGRVRFLDQAEIARLLATCEKDHFLHAFAIVALNSGMRRNELLSLTRRSVDFANRIANLDDTKNGEARHVYLNDAALEALKSLPVPLDGGPLFPFKPNQVSVAFQRAVRRAQIDDFRLHDLRHTFASYQAMAGTPGRGLQELLGHKDARMTTRYSHLSDSYLRRAVDNVVLGQDKNQRPALVDAKAV